MKRFFRLTVGVLLFFSVFFCAQKNDTNETILKGKMELLVDETVLPIIEDQKVVFENTYDAKLTLEPKSEAELIQSLLKDSSKVAVLSRKLSEKEKQHFIAKKIVPKVTFIATDAIAFIVNKNNIDTLIELKSVLDFMKGNTQQKFKGLVFDNPNSSTVRYMKELAKIDFESQKGVYSFKTNEEVIKYVAENEGMIGVVGVNWLSQSSETMAHWKNKTKVMSVKGVNSEEFVYPTQNNLAEKKYPLARDLYIINCQGYSGLAMGFASFVAGEIGQRIVLKSDLLPAKMPSRKIVLRKGILKENK